MLLIQNGSHYKWCCYYGCNQVCSLKQGELTVSKEVHKDGDDTKTEENQEEQGLDQSKTINQVF